MQHGAALAFYTIFAISPTLLIATSLAGLWFGQEAASTKIFAELATLIGDEGAKALQALLSQTDRPDATTLATSAALVVLLIGATTVFAQLQGSLNHVWKVTPKPGHVIRGFLKTRLLSFAMIVVIGFLLLVSLILSAALAAVISYFSGRHPGLEFLWQILELIVSYGVTSLLFAMIFRFLPDARIGWRDVWVGAAITGALFTIGKFLIGLYLGRSAVASTYGAAGSLVIVLLWVYYSSLILFYGAEFTQVYAERIGSRIEPAPNAMWLDDKPPKEHNMPENNSSV